MAKLLRERGVAERRREKQARKAARKQAATHEEQAPPPTPAQEAAQPLANQPAVGAATRAFGDMARSDGSSGGERSA